MAHRFAFSASGGLRIFEDSFLARTSSTGLAPQPIKESPVIFKNVLRLLFIPSSPGGRHDNSNRPERPRYSYGSGHKIYPCWSGNVSRCWKDSSDTSSHRRPRKDGRLREQPHFSRNR